MPNIENTHTIPTLTNLVAAGNPSKKAQPKQQGSNSSHLDDLNQRIDEIENAIGQDNSGPVGRAFAIRAESNNISRHTDAFKVKTDIKN